MTPQKLTLADFVAGDHWPGIPSVTIVINGAPPASALASARLRFLKVDASGDVVELTSAAGKITLVSAANWEMSIPEQAVPGLTAGRWRWNLETTDAAGVVKTYLQGCQTVLEDV